MDLLSAVFLGCFVFGFGAVAASLLLGGLHGFDLGGHQLHLTSGDAPGGDLHGGLHVGPFPLSSTTVFAFLTWFGGAGFVLRNYYGVLGAVSLAVAALVGLVGAALVSLLLLKVLLPYQTVMEQADYDPVGSVGRISAPIRAGGVGEVVYTRGGTRRSLGARSVDGRALERGAEVVIAKYERGLAYVQPWAEFVSRERREVAAEGNES